MLEFWREIDAFKTSLKLSEGRPIYSFYDGPPFATGLPHYGHLLAGTIKVRNLASPYNPFFAHRGMRVGVVVGGVTAGHRHAPRARLGLPRTAPFRLGHARRAS